MASQQSEAARVYAFEDARHDILELHDQINRMRGILACIAYPRRGTKEESMNLQEYADLIQGVYTSDDLRA